MTTPADNLFDIRGMRIVLTGGLGLLGRSYTKAFAERGAEVHVLDILEPLNAEKLIGGILTGETRNLVHYHQANITDRKRLSEIKAYIARRGPMIDALVNNAAYTGNSDVRRSNPGAGTFEDFPIKQWQKEIEVNLTGAMIAAQVFGSVIKRDGSVINVSSIYGVVGPDPQMYPEGFVKPVSYSVTKGALIALTRYLATYWGKREIRVNCVVLGGVENEQGADFVEKYSARTPLGRMAHPADYIGIMVFLVSRASAYSTGAVYVVDGGWTAW